MDEKVKIWTACDAYSAVKGKISEKAGMGHRAEMARWQSGRRSGL